MLPKLPAPLLELPYGFVVKFTLSEDNVVASDQRFTIQPAEQIVESSVNTAAVPLAGDVVLAIVVMIFMICGSSQILLTCN